MARVLKVCHSITNPVSDIWMLGGEASEPVSTPLMRMLVKSVMDEVHIPHQLAAMIHAGSEGEKAPEQIYDRIDIFGAVVTPLFEYDCRDSRCRAHWDRWGFGWGEGVCVSIDIGTANLTKSVVTAAVPSGAAVAECNTTATKLFPMESAGARLCVTMLGNAPCQAP